MDDGRAVGLKAPPTPLSVCSLGSAHLGSAANVPKVLCPQMAPRSAPRQAQVWWLVVDGWMMDDDGRAVGLKALPIPL